MKLFYTDIFALPLPESHRFPMAKYTRLRERILASKEFRDSQLVVPHAATDDELLLAHSADYLHLVQTGTLPAKLVRGLGFPWSPQLVERSRRSVGATIEASRTALADGVAVNLAGGTHHAYRDRCEGYCVFNDAVVAARVLQREGLINRAVIIDVDVHQGNGTAKLTEDDPSIFSFSIHGERNYPRIKETSDLDIGLEKDTGDAEYLDALERGLTEAIRRAKADLAIYLAGADPYKEDRLGTLALSKTGLAERDRLVFAACARVGLPVTVTLAGGYSPNIEDIVDIHFRTIMTPITG